MILPPISYSVQLWGTAASVHIERLRALQKEIVRIICGLHPGHTLNHVFSYYICWLWIKSEITLLQSPCKRSKSNMIPGHFGQMLPALPQFIIILQSLQKKSLYVDIVRNERGKGTIRHFRRELWNIVLNAIDVNCSIGYFKLSLKGFLFSFLYKDVCQELLKFDVWDVWFFSINFHIFVFSKDNLFCISVTCLCCLFHTIKMVSYSQ